MTIGLEKTRELRRAYYAAVSFVDSELGRVISEVIAVVNDGLYEDGGHCAGRGHDDDGDYDDGSGHMVVDRSGSPYNANYSEGEGAGTLGEHNHCSSW